ncbi:glutathione S-transferase [Maritimibacter sp. 55A14]|uniref:glutathione S-transferase family protein n=1 Tax=Maritimibacter sp. 55A14 TaxID=2174844 RepID=UPI000D60B999|nr:glutathione S-transferase family protein [Maritimibacter sp. 55A14]PWE32847.1 glutathione S-transferase [Maritimibacter sp. 55A14]
MTLTLFTYDWLPEFPRGFVRDMRVRWGLEELGRPYRVETVPVHPKSEAHRRMQPFGQVPVIRDGDLTLFESGAILLHLGEGGALMPEPRRAAVTQWLFAALNTVEIASSHWMQMVLAGRFPDFFGPAPAAAVKEHARQGMDARLAPLEQELAGRDWLAGDFSIADIAMVEVLRVLEAEGALADYPALTAYVGRGTDRPAFKKAMADHMAHWEAADSAPAAGRA